MHTITRDGQSRSANPRRPGPLPPPPPQYLLVALAQAPPVLAWVAQIVLLTLGYRAAGTAWLLLLWLPICGVAPLVEAACAVALTWLLLPCRLPPGKAWERGPCS